SFPLWRVFDGFLAEERRVHRDSAKAVPGADGRPRKGSTMGARSLFAGCDTCVDSRAECGEKTPTAQISPAANSEPTIVGRNRRAARRKPAVYQAGRFFSAHE